MKNRIFNQKLILKQLRYVVIIFIFCRIAAPVYSNNADTVLLITGTFSLKNNLARDIRVILKADDGSIIDSMTVAGNQEFGFYLLRNQLYTVEIMKEGFVTRKVGISTELPEGNKKRKPWYNFHFQIPLIRQSDDYADNKFVKYIYDLPSGFIYYNPQADVFDYSKEYSDALKERLRKAKAEQRAK